MSARGLHPRHRLDLDVATLRDALLDCARDLDPGRCARDLEGSLDPGGELVATLSARSAFDLLLSALSLPRGTEVLLSAWTIPDMVRIVRAHGLVPVPVDIDTDTFEPLPGSLERARSLRARVLVVAQLFGARVPLAPWASVARREGWLLVDDDAQGFTGPSRLRGDPDADVSLFSFGTIKTATALGGGLARVRDATLRARMRSILAGHPVQAAGAYARKVASVGSLAALHDPRGYGLFAEGCARLGGELDAVMMRATRGFPAPSVEALLPLLRRRPCAALCRAMQRRVERFTDARVRARAAAGDALHTALGPGVGSVGARARERTHWLIALDVDRPDGLCHALRTHGYDAARGTSSLAAVPAPPERSECLTERASRLDGRVLFVPGYPELPASERGRMAGVIRGYVAGGS